MNNVVLLLGIFIATLGLTQTSSGLTLGMSSEKILETQHLILLGTVDSVETRSGDTEYDITVLEYVKTPADFNKVDTLHVIGCGEGQIGGCITFDEGQDVLFILDERNNKFQVSELSFVSPNPNCTINDLFRYNNEKYDGLSLYQGSENSRHLYTNQPITAQYYHFNKNLEATSVDVTITVVDNFPDILKEETIRLDLDECQPNAKAEMEFVIDSPGSFAISAKVEDNGGGNSFSGVKVIDYVASPLKQFNSGIPLDKIQCKEGLELVLKSHDDSPACVRQETKAKLIGIGWMKTQVNVHDDSSFIESTKNLKEVQLFLSLHPDAKTNVNHEWFTVEYEKSGFREYSASRIIQHAKQLIIGLDYEGRPSAHTMICGGPVSLETGNMTFLENPDWCFPLDQSRFNSIKQENENDIRMDCNNRDGRVEAQCFKDSLESCVPAITHSVIYTLEGDALYLEAIIADDCKIHVTFDNSGDRFGRSDKGINSYVCNNVELHEKHIWVIDDCAGYPEFQINYEAHEWASHQKCTDLGGVWNYTFHNCVGVFNENQCQKTGGTSMCMSYEQMGHGRDVCQRVCEFQPADRK